jgi:transcriptional regulator with XRE-family HTH domain
VANLRERIKELRLEKGLSQGELAKYMQIRNRSTLAGWELGRVSPDHKMIIKMANFFGVSTDYLLGVTDDRKHTEDIQTKMKDGRILSGYAELFDGLEAEDFEKVVKIIDGYKAKAQAERELKLDK